MRVLITQSPFNMNWIDFDLITSVDGLDSGLEQVSLFPNPSSDNINLTATLAKTQNVKIMILNMSGKLLMQMTLNDVSQIDEIISIGELQNGVYLVKLEMENGSAFSEHFLKI